MKITVNKKEFKNALEIAAKVASGTGRIREYDRVYIGVDSSKPDGIFVFGKGSGGAVQIALRAEMLQMFTIRYDELIEFCAKLVLDELKTYDTAEVVFSIVRIAHKSANRNDRHLYIGSLTENTECDNARIIKNDFAFVNSKAAYIIMKPASELTSAIKSTFPFIQKPDAKFTDEYWACGVHLSATSDSVTLKATDRHTLAHVEMQGDFVKKGDDFEITLKPGALNVFVNNVIKKGDYNAIIISPGAENEHCIIQYRNCTFSVPKINQRYQYGKALVSMTCDYSIILPKSEFIDALKGFIKDCGKEHGAYLKLKTHVDYIAFKDTKGLGFEYGVAGKKQYGKMGFEIGFNAPMLLSVLKAIQWSGDEVEFSIHLNKDKKYACAGALFTNPNDENEDVKASWYVCEVMLNTRE